MCLALPPGKFDHLWTPIICITTLPTAMTRHVSGSTKAAQRTDIMVQLCDAGEHGHYCILPHREAALRFGNITTRYQYGTAPSPHGSIMARHLLNHDGEEPLHCTTTEKTALVSHLLYTAQTPGRALGNIAPSILLCTRA